jgi:diguanylate cyclase (GGDEF)-like protein
MRNQNPKDLYLKRLGRVPHSPLAFWVHFFKNFLILMGVVLVTLCSIYLLEKQSTLEDYKARSGKSLLNLREGIQKNLSRVQTDLNFLATQYVDCSVQDIVTGCVDSNNSKQFLNSFLQTQKVYSQIRLLDLYGNQIVQVNLTQDASDLKAESSLENISDRDWFKDLQNLNLGQIYISGAVLRSMQGEVLKPYQPMIRFGVPIFNSTGIKLGFLLLNYDMNDLFEDFARATTGSAEQYFILNSQGYWLWNQQKSLEWGFLLDNGTNVKIGAFDAELWKQMRVSEFMQVATGASFISSMKVLPIKHELGVVGLDHFIVYSEMARGNLIDELSSLYEILSLLAGISFILSTILSLILARSVVKARFSEDSLKEAAMFDNLTGLPNRTLFFDRLDKIIKQSQRYKRDFAVLFLDLDGFKEVNDTYGHKAGDELLQQLAVRMSGVLRESDTLGRVGGDEFVALLDGVANHTNAGVVAQKLLEVLSAQVELKKARVQVGGSIGVALFDYEFEESAEELLKRADALMYEVKKAGKNGFRISGKPGLKKY